MNAFKTLGEGNMLGSNSMNFTILTIYVFCFIVFQKKMSHVDNVLQICDFFMVSHSHKLVHHFHTILLEGLGQTLQIKKKKKSTFK